MRKFKEKRTVYYDPAMYRMSISPAGIHYLKYSPDFVGNWNCRRIAVPATTCFKGFNFPRVLSWEMLSTLGML